MGDNLRILFIGNLAVSITDQMIRSFCEGHGIRVLDVEKAVDIKVGKQGSNYAFVKVENRSDLENIVSNLERDHYFEDFPDRKISVQFTKSIVDEAKKREQRSRLLIPSESLFVVGFDPLTTKESDIVEEFSKIAPVKRVLIHSNYANVHFHTVEDATKIVNEFKGQFRGRTLTIEYKMPREHQEHPQHSSRGGYEGFEGREWSHRDSGDWDRDVRGRGGRDYPPQFYPPDPYGGGRNRRNPPSFGPGSYPLGGVPPQWGPGPYGTPYHPLGGPIGGPIPPMWGGPPPPYSSRRSGNSRERRGRSGERAERWNSQSSLGGGGEDRRGVGRGFSSSTSDQPPQRREVPREGERAGEVGEKERDRERGGGGERGRTKDRRRRKNRDSSTSSDSSRSTSDSSSESSHTRSSSPSNSRGSRSPSRDRERDRKKRRHHHSSSSSHRRSSKRPTSSSSLPSSSSSSSSSSKKNQREDSIPLGGVSVPSPEDLLPPPSLSLPQHGGRGGFGERGERGGGGRGGGGDHYQQWGHGGGGGGGGGGKGPAYIR